MRGMAPPLPKLQGNHNYFPTSFPYHTVGGVWIFSALSWYFLGLTQLLAVFLASFLLPSHFSFIQGRAHDAAFLPSSRPSFPCPACSLLLHFLSCVCSPASLPEFPPSGARLGWLVVGFPLLPSSLFPSRHSQPSIAAPSFSSSPRYL